MSELLVTYVTYLVYALNLAIFGRVVMSWVSPRGDDPISSILYQVTEPILAPIRRVMPSMGMFDLTPMVALLLLNFVILPVLRAVL